MLVVFLPTFVADAKFIYGYNFVAPSTFARIFIMVKQYEFQGSRLESISIYVLQFYLKRRQKLHKKVNYLAIHVLMILRPFLNTLMNLNFSLDNHF